MPEKKQSVFLIIMGVLVAMSTMAAFVSSRKKVTLWCRDVRIAMDGSYSVMVEEGGLKTSPELTLYTEHNRKRIKVEKLTVAAQENTEGRQTFVGDNLKLIVHNRKQVNSGRSIASLQGKVAGEAVSVTLSCAD